MCDNLRRMSPVSLHEMLADCPGTQMHLPRPGFPCIAVRNDAGEALIALQGAQVLEYRPTHTPHPVLYRSPLAAFVPGVEIMGGVPLCWPWFSKHPEDPTKPFHGIAQTIMWELLEVFEKDAAETVLRFRLPANRIEAEFWPWACEVILVVSVGAALDVTLTTENTGDDSFVLGGAMHTYFAVSDRTAVAVEGLEGKVFTDFMAGGEQRIETAPVRFPDAVSRLYPDVDPLCRLVDPAWHRQVLITSRGSHTLAVWNPDLNQTRPCPHLPDDAFHSFVCLEPVNTAEDRPSLAPGKAHTLGCRIEVAAI